MADHARASGSETIAPSDKTRAAGGEAAAPSDKTKDKSPCSCCGGTVTTPCCGAALPRTIHAVRTAFTGDCNCWPASATLIFDDSLGYWIGYPGSYCGLPELNIPGIGTGDYPQFRLSCFFGDNFTLNLVSSPGTGYSAFGEADSCDPLSMEVAVSIGGSGAECTGSFTYHFTG